MTAVGPSIPRTAAGRAHYLDSLRGIAALIVVVFHAAIVHPEFWAFAHHPPLAWLHWWPARLLWGGHEAVVFFFLLSGFVLAWPWVEGRPPVYSAFLWKRVLRLYPPFLATYLVGLGLFWALSTYSIEGLTTTFNGYWNRPVTGPDIVKHLLMASHTNHINPAVWSLVDEARFSLIFPLLAVACLRLRSSVAAAVALLIGGVAASVATVRPSEPTLVATATSTVAETLKFMPVFVAGILLARSRHRVAAHVCGWSRARRGGALVVALSLIGVMKAPLANEALNLAFASAGFALLIAVVLGSASLQRWLSGPALTGLGAISYSLYLSHTSVMYSLFYAFHEVVPGWALSVATVPMSLVVGAAFYQLVERPSMRWARAAGGKQEQVRTIAR